MAGQVCELNSRILKPEGSLPASAGRSSTPRIEAVHTRTKLAARPGSPSLFFEVIETVTTRDESFEDRDGWGTRRVRPPGPGWRIDHDRERHTRWFRRRPVVWPRSPSIVPSITPGRRR